MPRPRQQQQQQPQQTVDAACLRLPRAAAIQQRMLCSSCRPLSGAANASGTLEDFVVPKTDNLMRRYLERQQTLGGKLHTLHDLSFGGDGKFRKLALRHGAVDAESEMIQLRALLLVPHETPLTWQQQLQLQQHVERLQTFTPPQLALLLEECFLSGMLDVPQLQQLRHLLRLQRLQLANDIERQAQQPLISFYRRLPTELPHFRYDLSLPQHVAMLHRYLQLHEACPKPQARRLLNASLVYMTTLPLPQLEHFLDALNPAQLNQLTAYFSRSYVALPPREQQRLHRTALRVQRHKPRLHPSRCHQQLLSQLLSEPVDGPLTLQQRSYLQCLLDHLLPMARLQQLHWLQRLQLSSTRLRQLRLMLHNPALLAHPLQLRQLYVNLKQLVQHQ